MPEWITIVVGAVEQGETILHLICSQRRVDLASAQWRENWSHNGNENRVLRPFLLRLLPLPKGWRVLTNGIPDMARSVAEHGKFHLPQQSRTA